MPAELERLREVEAMLDAELELIRRHRDPAAEHRARVASARPRSPRSARPSLSDQTAPASPAVRLFRRLRLAEGPPS